MCRCLRMQLIKMGKVQGATLMVTLISIVILRHQRHISHMAALRGLLG